MINKYEVMVGAVVITVFSIVVGTAAAFTITIIEKVFN